MYRLLLQLLKLIYLFIFATILFADGGFDSGTSAGKGNFDISLTLNNDMIFPQGQSYIVLGYGLTDKLDIASYYSKSTENGSNYYTGILYQFIDNSRMDISSAFGIRKFSDNIW